MCAVCPVCGTETSCESVFVVLMEAGSLQAGAALWRKIAPGPRGLCSWATPPLPHDQGPEGAGPTPAPSQGGSLCAFDFHVGDREVAVGVAKMRP